MLCGISNLSELGAILEGTRTHSRMGIATDAVVLKEPGTGQAKKARPKKQCGTKARQDGVTQAPSPPKTYRPVLGDSPKPDQQAEGYMFWVRNCPQMLASQCPASWMGSHWEEIWKEKPGRGGATWRAQELTCDHNLGLCSSSASPADCRALI
jgi:hypothetical protein